MGLVCKHEKEQREVLEEKLLLSLAGATLPKGYGQRLSVQRQANTSGSIYMYIHI